MGHYLLRRLLLLPLTLFAILLVNFVILNLAKGDPTELMDAGKSGEMGRSESMKKHTFDDPYLQFREHFGLTRPILFNRWPSLPYEKVKKEVVQLVKEKETMEAAKRHRSLLLWGDRARFLMPSFFALASDESIPFAARRLALNLFIRGGTHLCHMGPKLTEKEKAENRKIEADNLFLLSLRGDEKEEEALFLNKLSQAKEWLGTPKTLTSAEKWQIFFFETRFARYFSKIIHLDFGVLRTDPTKLVITEVGKRLKYSLTLALLPMLVSFGLAQLFGVIMSLRQNQFVDYSLNTFFLILFAIPVFVFAPFVIEKLALGNHLPFTQIPWPTSSFHSENGIYNTFTSLHRLGDVLIHLALPLLCILYGMLAIQVRIARYAILEALNQDYVRTAHAKGLPLSSILFKHVGKNASLTLVTSFASSFGTILAGSLIVETIFNIHGFGRFFYEALVNRDYHVILFSALASSFLTLVGYFLADFAYMLLDPRIRIEAKS